MPIKTSSAKSKGRKLQKQVMHLLIKLFQFKEIDDISSRSMGSPGVDIILSPHARKWIPFSIECKKTKKMPSVSEMNQARNNCYPDTIPAVVWQPHGSGESQTMITFNLKEFMTVWSRWATEERKRYERSLSDLDRLREVQNKNFSSGTPS